MKDLDDSKDQRIAELERAGTQRKWGELRLQEALRYAESIVETVREPLVVLDANLKVLSANRSFYATFKVTPEDTVRHTIYELGNGEWDIPELRRLLEEILSEKETVDDFEVDHDFKDIGRKIMLLNGRRIYRKDMGTQTILLAIEDITERKGVDSVLRESEGLYKSAFETARDAVALLEKGDGHISHANPAFGKLLGYSIEECIGKKLADVGVLPGMGDFQRILHVLDESGFIHYEDVPVRTKAGEDVDTDIYLVDKTKLVQCNIRNITERKLGKKKQKVSEENYRSLFENVVEGIFQTTPEGCFITVNPAMVRMYGFASQEEMLSGITDIGKEQYVNPEDRKRFVAILEDKGTVNSFETQVFKKDGDIIWTSISARAIKDAAGTICRIDGTEEDITSRKQAEEALRDSESKYQFLAESMADVVFTLDMNLATTYVSPSIEGMLGYTPEERIAQKVDQQLTPKSQKLAFEALVAEMEREKEKGSDPDRSLTLELEDYHKDGSIKYLTTYIRGIRDSEGNLTGFYGSHHDITERKQAEEDLRRTVEKLRKAFGATIQVMVAAVEVRDPYTAGHQIRSADLARAIATEMGLPQERVDGIRMSGSIHDIGKLSIPSQILSKPTTLTDIEFSMIKDHSRRGYEMLKDIEFPWPLAQIVYQHHERMNGTGYPRNLKGDEILMDARIMAVADVVEAMASHRPYRPALGLDAALEEIEKNKGTLYDNVVADACLRLFRKKGYTLHA